MKSYKKIGIALSGGGVRGIAHLGVIKALQEANIPIEMVSGTSAGAIVGALFCQGFSPDEILEIILRTNYFRFIRPAISWKGILKMDMLETLYRKYLVDNSFESLKIPLSITATDFKKGKSVYFYQGELIRPLLASACIPGIFEPIKIGNRHYVDGGVLNNLPVEALEKECEYIIGVNCNHLPESDNVHNMKRMIERTVIMSINYNVYSRKNKCDYFIEPKGLAEFGVFDIKSAQAIFDTGYKSTQEFIRSNNAITELGKEN
ncbi:patatin-like phospholipase family protein [Echinicola jeungdonensis]|uniref:Patatin-like phospholipase family protein n=1 Tax=Echinicola jeungdonensis TaxID=709343 RepID=A0ABV5J6Y9_9BACT|nr:patatin-like phospholipase family protein [Echinicola jeungdonensis]MDN3670769.1 patatin-like phospholipase family protein [Echinicola jeungdonensis]